MTVDFLGTGGFYNASLPYNALLLDGKFLLETPPDIVPSLGRMGFDLEGIEAIFISHIHGDHIFGAPFLLFNMWKGDSSKKGPLIVGPREIRDAILEAARLAIPGSHPYLPWIADACQYRVVAAGGEDEILGRRCEYYHSYHELETLGLGLSGAAAGRPLFQYLPDTRWDEGLLPLLNRGAKLLVCDLNGTGGHREVHMGLEDLLPALAGLERPPERVIGTHLSGPMEGRQGGVEFARPGMRVEIGEG